MLSQKLALKAVRGAGWTIVTGVGARALGLVGTVVLTYFLSPEIQGEVSDAFIVILTAHQVTYFGAANYLVAHPEAGRDVTFNVLVFQIVTGIAALGAVVLARDHFDGLLHAHALGRYIPGLALAMFIERVGIIPEKILARDLKFRTIGLARTAGELGYSVMSVALAFAGFGGMAIVYANVLRSVLYLALVALGTPRAEWLVPAPLSRATMGPVLRYGVPLSVGNFATFASRRGDNLLMSGMFGTETVGYYNLAYNLADVPAVQVGEQIGDVLLPSFSRMKTEDRKNALVKSSGLLALVVFPLAVGLGVVAPTLTHALLKPAWQPVGPMLVILAALSVVRPVGWTISSYLQASDMPRATMVLGTSKVLLLFASMWALGRFGPLWACVGVGVAFGFHSLASVAVVHRAHGVRAGALLASLARPLAACVPMAAAVLGVRYLLRVAGVHAPLVGVVCEIVAGALGYVGAAFVVARPISSDFVRLVRRALSRRRTEEDDVVAAPAAAPERSGTDA